MTDHRHPTAASRRPQSVVLALAVLVLMACSASLGSALTDLSASFGTPTR